MGDITISGTTQRITQPQDTNIPKAPPPPPPPVPKADPAPTESTRLSNETQGSSQSQKAAGTSHFAQAFGDAAMKALGISGKGGLGEKVHSMKEKVSKEASRAEKYKEGLPEDKMEKLKNAAGGGSFKKAAAAALMGTDIKGLPDAIKRAEQWNSLPQEVRDVAVTGLKMGSTVLGKVDGVIHPD